MKLIIIDPQVGFLEKVKNKEEMVGRWNKLLEVSTDKKVTRYINETDSAWRMYDWHKMGKGSKEVELVELVVEVGEVEVIDKGFYSLGKVQEIGWGNGEKVYLAGIDTDACAYATAIDYFERGWRVVVIEDACVSSGGKEAHETAIRLLERNAFAEIVNMEEYIRWIEKGDS